MFSTKEMLIRRTGKNPVNRFEFLKQLAHEYQTTISKDYKEQVLANLANFAYDPINYEYIKKLGIIDVFLDELVNNNEKILQFALAGICNLCLDPENKTYILSKRGVSLVANCLFKQNEEIITDAITTLIFLITPTSKTEITCPEIIECIVTHLQHPSVRVRNLAQVYLETCCTKRQVSEATRKVASQISKFQIQGQESEDNNLPS